MGRLNNTFETTYPSLLVDTVVDVLEWWVQHPPVFTVDPMVQVVNAPPGLVVALQRVAVDQAQLLVEAHAATAVLVGLLVVHLRLVIELCFVLLLRGLGLEQTLNVVEIEVVH